VNEALEADVAKARTWNTWEEAYVIQDKILMSRQNALLPTWLLVNIRSG